MPVFNLILISLILMTIIFAALGIKLLIQRNAKIEFQGCSNANGESSCACVNVESCKTDDVNQPVA